MNGLGGAKCRGMGPLFESTNLVDHYEAKLICAECPAIEACRALLEAELTGSAWSRCAGPRGTWAGELLGEKSNRRALPREHGTDRGYYQHRYRRETACAECRGAHVKAVQEKEVS